MDLVHVTSLTSLASAIVVAHTTGKLGIFNELSNRIRFPNRVNLENCELDAAL